MNNRLIEDRALDNVEREQAIRRNMAVLRTDFERFVVLLCATGWGQREIATTLAEHGRGYGRGNIHRIVAQAKQNFEEID